jgi:hypothetical protein
MVAQRTVWFWHYLAVNCELRTGLLKELFSTARDRFQLRRAPAVGPVSNSRDAHSKRIAQLRIQIDSIVFSWQTMSSAVNANVSPEIFPVKLFELAAP